MRNKTKKQDNDIGIKDLTLGDILVDTNGKQRRILGKGFENGVESYLLSKYGNFENVCGWYTIEEINKKGYTLVEHVRTQHKLPKEIKRNYKHDRDNRSLKNLFIAVVVALIATFAIQLIVSLTSSIFRVKTETRLDHVKDKACMSLIKRLDGKSDAAKHLAFQNCADLYVKDDLQTIKK